jgi:hypothetical protein
MNVLETFVKDLEKLPAPKLLEVARFVHTLGSSHATRRKEALEATAGCMIGEEGEVFEKVVREEADRINADDWK